MRDVELAQMSVQVPVLLEAIKLASGLTFLGLYEALAPSMGVSPESLKRSWQRWKVVGSNDSEGRLVRRDTLRLLVEAASSRNWLPGEESPCGPLLALLAEGEVRERAASVLAAKRRLTNLRDYVRSKIRERGFTQFDDVSWLSAIYSVVDAEVVRDLRARLLDGRSEGDFLPFGLQDELLSGAVSRIVKRVRESSNTLLLEFEKEVRRMEHRVHSEFLTLQRDTDERADS